MRESQWENFSKGIFKENPVLLGTLGLCPVLALTHKLETAIEISALFILVQLVVTFSVSLLKGAILEKFRLEVILLVAGFWVSFIERFLWSISPDVLKNLSIFLPLLAVNEVILGRAGSYAYKEKLFNSIIDSLGMGLGVSLIIIIMAFFRELLGDGKLLGRTIFTPLLPLLYLPPGGFFLVALFIFVYRNARSRIK